MGFEGAKVERDESERRKRSERRVERSLGNDGTRWKGKEDSAKDFRRFEVANDADRRKEGRRGRERAANNQTGVETATAPVGESRRT